jgi:hypothetical protein
MESVVDTTLQSLFPWKEKRIRTSGGPNLFTLVYYSLLSCGIIPYLQLKKIIIAGSAIAIETESKITWYKYLPYNIVVARQVL